MKVDVTKKEELKKALTKLEKDFDEILENGRGKKGNYFKNDCIDEIEVENAEVILESLPYKKMHKSYEKSSLAFFWALINNGLKKQLIGFMKKMNNSGYKYKFFCSNHFATVPNGLLAINDKKYIPEYVNYMKKHSEHYFEEMESIMLEYIVNQHKWDKNMLNVVYARIKQCRREWGFDQFERWLNYDGLYDYLVDNGKLDDLKKFSSSEYYDEYDREILLGAIEEVEEKRKNKTGNNKETLTPLFEGKRVAIGSKPDKLRTYACYDFVTILKGIWQEKINKKTDIILTVNSGDIKKKTTAKIIEWKTLGHIDELFDVIHSAKLDFKTRYENNPEKELPLLQKEYPNFFEDPLYLLNFGKELVYEKKMPSAGFQVIALINSSEWYRMSFYHKDGNSVPYADILNNTPEKYKAKWLSALLGVALEEGNLEWTKKALKAGANPNKVATPGGQSGLEMAFWSYESTVNIALLEPLLDHGMDINVRNSAKETLAHHVTKNIIDGYKGLSESKNWYEGKIEPWIDILKLLIQKGIDTTLENEHKKTASDLILDRIHDTGWHQAFLPLIQIWLLLNKNDDKLLESWLKDSSFEQFCSQPRNKKALEKYFHSLKNTPKVLEYYKNLKIDDIQVQADDYYVLEVRLYRYTDNYYSADSDYGKKYYEWEWNVDDLMSITNRDDELDIEDIAYKPMLLVSEKMKNIIEKHNPANCTFYRVDLDKVDCEDTYYYLDCKNSYQCVDYSKSKIDNALDEIKAFVMSTKELKEAKDNERTIFYMKGVKDIFKRPKLMVHYSLAEELKKAQDNEEIGGFRLFHTSEWSSYSAQHDCRLF